MIESFFDVYAHEYDYLTDAKSRVKYHETEIKAIIKRFQPEMVLDAGCATGLTSWLFARNGINTTGLDRSRKMLSVAREKYENRRYPIQFKYGHFEKISARMHRKFDLVVSLANSISGVKTQAGLRQALRNFYRALKPGGYLVIQVLNILAYDEGKLNPVKATRHKNIIYERFSERQGNMLYIYVSRLDMEKKPPRLEIFRHKSANFTIDEITKGLKRLDFTHIEKYGNLRFSKKFTKSSRDLVLVCRR